MFYQSSFNVYDQHDLNSKFKLLLYTKLTDSNLTDRIRVVATTPEKTLNLK